MASGLQWTNSQSHMASRNFVLKKNLRYFVYDNCSFYSITINTFYFPLILVGSLLSLVSTCWWNCWSTLFCGLATLWWPPHFTPDKIIFRKTIIRRPSQSDHGSSSLYFGLLTHNYRCSGFPLQHLHFGVNIIFQTSKYYT